MTFIFYVPQLYQIRQDLCLRFSRYSPAANLSHHLHWELETGYTCTLATFRNARGVTPSQNQAISKSQRQSNRFSHSFQGRPSKNPFALTPPVQRAACALLFEGSVPTKISRNHPINQTSTTLFNLSHLLEGCVPNFSQLFQTILHTECTPQFFNEIKN